MRKGRKEGSKENAKEREEVKRDEKRGKLGKQWFTCELIQSTPEYN